MHADDECYSAKPDELGYTTASAGAIDSNVPYPRSQTTYLRWYRRGGTLGDNYSRIDQVPIGGSPQKYIDIWADYQIEEADTVSFTNDVPVTSTLPVPVLTTLTAAINTTNQVVNVTPASMANISVSQQINLGNVGGAVNTRL